MMHIYAADDHIMFITDTINADFHRHSFMQLSISLQSAFIIKTSEKQFPCRGIVIDSNTDHYFDGNQNLLLFLLIDHTSGIAKQLRQTLLRNENSYILPDEIIEKIALLINRDMHSINDTNYFELLSKILTTLGLQDFESNTTDGRISKIIEQLRSCTQSDHSIKQLAESVFLSPSRLSHLFKQYTGVSLNTYIVHHKLQKALFHIFNGTAITDAAMLAGFDSPSHLAATSKRLLGMSAKEIRKDSVFLKVSRYQSL